MGFSIWVTKFQKEQGEWREGNHPKTNHNITNFFPYLKNMNFLIGKTH